MELARDHKQEEAVCFLGGQAAWAGMLPSQWAEDTRIEIMENGTKVAHTSGVRICISTSKPLPAGLERFYFVTTIQTTAGKARKGSNGDFPVVAIGFCTIGGSAITFPGWPPRAAAPSAQSWGYHGQDGCLLSSCRENGSTVANGIPYREGHVIGCGVDLSTQTIWFTRDEHRLASEFKDVKGRLFPLLGLMDNIVVQTNFAGPFIWEEGE